MKNSMSEEFGICHNIKKKKDFRGSCQLVFYIRSTKVNIRFPYLRFCPIFFVTGFCHIKLICNVCLAGLIMIHRSKLSEDMATFMTVSRTANKVNVPFPL